MHTLLLFDIDGTLVTGGPAKVAFERAMLQTFDTTGPIETHDFSGKTDRQIARELLRAAGRPDPEIEQGFEDLFATYLAELERMLIGLPMVALPGVMDLLGYLRDREDVGLGLVTGNVADGARLKLESAEIDADLFPVGGFGSDHEHRNELPGVALERARDHWGRTPAPDRVVVIGDTPRDVACGKAHGLRTVAVATGRVSRDRLAETTPDALLDNFRDLDETLAALL